MSWSVNGNGETKELALDALNDALQNAAVTGTCPNADKLVQAAGLMLETYPADVAVKISSFGHTNADGTGNACVKFNY